jgi:hypothetical protein
MAREIKNLDSDMQQLVYENYNKFIAATDTIRAMKSTVDGMQADMDQLGGSMGAAGSVATAGERAATRCHTTNSRAVTLLLLVVVLLLLGVAGVVLLLLLGAGSAELGLPPNARCRPPQKLPPSATTVPRGQWAWQLLIARQPASIPAAYATRDLRPALCRHLGDMCALWQPCRCTNM